MNKGSLSVMVKNNNISFVRESSDIEKVSISCVVDCALDLYRKYKIKKELMEEASLETEEDVKEANSDFDDYLNIVDNY